MSNLTDALIAAKLVGGSGGSGGGDSLPAVTVADNGNVLTVVDGAWGKAAPSGGSDIFVVHGILNDDDLTTVETFEQYKSAWNAGKVLFFALPSEEGEDFASDYILMHVGIAGESGITRFIATDFRVLMGALVYTAIQFNADGTVSMFTNRYTLTPAN